MSFVGLAAAVVAGLLHAEVGPPARGAPPQNGPIPPDSVLRLVDWAGLADLEPGVTCRQFSSSDPAGRGDDHGHFLALEGRRALLAEMDGPGAITRLWSANAAGRLQVFLDGEPTPRIDAPFQDLFTGGYAPFAPPVAIHQGGGWISFFPIPYARHCRVVVDELDHPGDLYYHVQYKTFPAGTPIRTFTRELPADEAANLARVLQIWNDPEHQPPPPTFSDQDRGAARVGLHVNHDGVQVLAFKLAPGKRVSDRAGARAVRGPATIDFLRVEVDAPDVEKLRGLLLEVWYGESAEPSISVPVADLFGVGFGPLLQPGLLLGYSEEGGYSRLPMPFPEGGALALANVSRVPIDALLEFTVVAGAPAQAGLLHAEYRRSDPVSAELYEFCRARGPGKYVGVNLTLQGVGDLWYLEGNEQFSVDGELTPSILGTGTEDFFNGGWYWDSGPFTLPLHGLGVKQEWTTNRTTPWRHQLFDSVPFARSLQARIEHGSSNEVLDASYSSVALWYAQSPQAVRRATGDTVALPRRFVRRPPNAVAAVDLAWTADSRVTPTRFESVSEEFRGSEFHLFQAFPVSHFERGQERVRPEFALMRADEAQAEFSVETGDRYRLRLQFAADRGPPPIEVFLDGTSLGTVDVAASRLEGDGMAPSSPPPLGPVGVAAGRHKLKLRRAAAGLGNSVRVGLDCVALEPASEFVKSWWIGPPVECRSPENAPYAATDAPDLASVDQAPAAEAALLAAAFDPAAAGWKEIAHDSGQLDLNALVTPRAPIFGYLMTFVFTPAARTTTVRLGSDDGVKVWLDGKPVFTHALHRPLALDADRFDLELAPGWHALLVKVRNDDGGYGLALRLADPDGTIKTATRRE